MRAMRLPDSRGIQGVPSCPSAPRAFREGGWEMSTRFRHTREPMSYNYSCIVDDETGRVVKWGVENEKAAQVCALFNLAVAAPPDAGKP